MLILRVTFRLEKNVSSSQMCTKSTPIYYNNCIIFFGVFLNLWRDIGGLNSKITIVALIFLSITINSEIKKEGKVVIDFFIYTRTYIIILIL